MLQFTIHGRYFSNVLLMVIAIGCLLNGLHAQSHNNHKPIHSIKHLQPADGNGYDLFSYDGEALRDEKWRFDPIYGDPVVSRRHAFRDRNNNNRIHVVDAIIDARGVYTKTYSSNSEIDQFLKSRVSEPINGRSPPNRGAIDQRPTNIAYPLSYNQHQNHRDNVYNQGVTVNSISSIYNVNNVYPIFSAPLGPPQYPGPNYPGFGYQPLPPTQNIIQQIYYPNGNIHYSPNGNSINENNNSNKTNTEANTSPQPSTTVYPDINKFITTTSTTTTTTANPIYDFDIRKYEENTETSSSSLADNNPTGANKTGLFEANGKQPVQMQPQQLHQPQNVTTRRPIIGLPTAEEDDDYEYDELGNRIGPTVIKSLVG